MIHLSVEIYGHMLLWIILMFKMRVIWEKSFPFVHDINTFWMKCICFADIKYKMIYGKWSKSINVQRPFINKTDFEHPVEHVKRNPEYKHIITNWRIFKNQKTYDVLCTCYTYYTWWVSLEFMRFSATLQ